MPSKPTTLVEVMAALRHPVEGCPWDLEQDHQSLKPYLIEETYEVLDALDRESPDELCEELGDLLLQIVFHSRLAEERGAFNFKTVERRIVDKMVRRHPHVFAPEGERPSAESVEANWERQKAKEGKRALSGVPRHLPALLRSIRVTEKAARVGFDWSFAEEVLDKVIEEAHELKAALKSRKQEEISAELGDLLFSLANFARHIDVDPEEALRHTIDRFTKRFEFVETALIERGDAVGETSLDELNLLWDEAKKSL